MRGPSTSKNRPTGINAMPGFSVAALPFLRLTRGINRVQNMPKVLMEWHIKHKPKDVVNFLSKIDMDVEHRRHRKYAYWNFRLSFLSSSLLNDASPLHSPCR